MSSILDDAERKATNAEGHDELGELTGKVHTVLGPVPIEETGITMPHEHLFVDLSCMFDPPTEATERRRAYQPISLENLNWIRTYYFRHYGNLLLDDEDITLAELESFRRAGGNTIVEVTPIGIGRDPIALSHVARVSGINIVMATGYYVAATHPPAINDMSQNEIARQMIEEILVGARTVRVSQGQQDWQPVVGNTGVKAGIIKVACSFPVAPNEKKVLQAAAVAQRETGAAITVHVGRGDQSALEIVQILEEAGARLDRTVLDHLDLRVEKFETLLEIAGSECFMEFDLFGHESSYYPFTRRDMPSDGQRLDTITKLIELGYIERILVSHDICTKHRLLKYGGHGYSHILTNIVPRMRERGFSREEIETITVRNPARVLAFAEPGA